MRASLTFRFTRLRMPEPRQTLTSMLAILVYYTLGWHAAAAEILAELALGLLLYGGGGGRPIRRKLRTFVARSLPRRILEPGTG